MNTLLPILADIYIYLVMFHMLGVTLGLGGAIMADVMFFKFLKDGKISRFENDVLHTISKVIWVAIVVLVITGAVLFVSKMDLLSTSAKFLTKMVVVGVIVVNGIAMNIFVSPNFEKIIFGGRQAMKQSRHYQRLRRLAFALGAVSILSWGTAFVLGVLRRIPFTMSQALLVYGVLLVLGVVISQIMERNMRYKK